MRTLHPPVKSLLVLSIVALLLLPLACKQRDDGKPKVALIMKSLANEFFETMKEGAWSHYLQHADQYSLVVVGMRDEQDVGQQVNMVEMMIAQGVAAIVIAPADSMALVPVCKRAMDAGIIVINIDNKFDGGVLADKGVTIPFVGPDNRKGARLAAEHLAQRLNAGDKVAILEGIPNAFNGIQRKLGFEDAMKAAQINIVSSQSAYWETSKAEVIAAALVTEHNDLKAILCANDSMALGAAAALRAAGKSDSVLLIGFDNISAVQQLLEEKRILCTVDQHGDKLAVYGIEYALEMIETKTVPADKETPVDLITGDTLP